jgi:hypothetical protein
MVVDQAVVTVFTRAVCAGRRAEWGIDSDGHEVRAGVPHSQDYRRRPARAA